MIPERYQGKRFTSFLVGIVVLAAGYLWGPPDQFVPFSTAVTLIYGAYVGGQSLTDNTKAKNGAGGVT